MQETKELNEGTGDEPKILTGIDVFFYYVKANSYLMFNSYKV